MPKPEGLRPSSGRAVPNSQSQNANLVAKFTPSRISMAWCQRCISGPLMIHCRRPLRTPTFE